MTGTCEDGKAQGRCRIRRGLSTQGGWLGSRQELRRGRLAGGGGGGGGGAASPPWQQPPWVLERGLEVVKAPSSGGGMIKSGLLRDDKERSIRALLPHSSSGRRPGVPS